MNRYYTNPCPVAGSPIWPGKAPSWLIQVLLQRSPFCVCPANSEVTWTRPGQTSTMADQQQQVSVRFLQTRAYPRTKKVPVQSLWSWFEADQEENPLNPKCKAIKHQPHWFAPAALSVRAGNVKYYANRPSKNQQQCGIKKKKRLLINSHEEIPPPSRFRQAWRTCAHCATLCFYTKTTAK